jgi:hypothetical protein
MDSWTDWPWRLYKGSVVWAPIHEAVLAAAIANLSGTKPTLSFQFDTTSPGDQSLADKFTAMSHFHLGKNSDSSWLKANMYSKHEFVFLPPKPRLDHYYGPYRVVDQLTWDLTLHHLGQESHCTAKEVTCRYMTMEFTSPISYHIETYSLVKLYKQFFAGTAARMENYFPKCCTYHKSMTFVLSCAPVVFWDTGPGTKRWRQEQPWFL